MRHALILAAAILCSPAIAEQSPFVFDTGESPAAWTMSSSRLADIASRDIGATGPQLGLPSREWCGAAINRWRRIAGLSVVPSNRAIDQARHGRRVAHAVPGALMITGRRRGAHVDIVVAVYSDGTADLIRPNWGRRVRKERARLRGFFVIPA
jgi:hypothetical protein